MANKNKKKIESFEQLANAQQHKRPAASQEEPAISTMLDEFEMWMAVNWKKAIIGVCAFAVLVSVVIIIQGAIQRAELAARRELANAGSIAELEAAIAKHPGNKAADFARLRLAGELITANQPGDLEKAREQLLAVASSSKSETYIKIRSALDAAYILEQLGKKEDAATEFERIAGLSQTPRDLGVEAAYSAARIFAGLDQMMKADAALKRINLAAAASEGLSSVYGYWASLAKQLDEKIHPQTASVTAPAPAEKPAEAKPADAHAAASETPAA
ncbi:MAG: hypothetical protein IKP09_07465 [Lentisphaeria bacterium]|nr:hypothetical protein [Lentisphaeria bacterium]